MSEPDGVEMNLVEFAEYLSRVPSGDLYGMVRDVTIQTQDMLIVQEAVLRVFRALFLDLEVTI